MSHVTTIECEIRDLAALEEALKHFPGAKLVRDQKTYAWYGRHVGDYPMPKGMTHADLGKCDHAIKVDGVRYEIGLRKTAKGAYTLAFDFFGYDHSSHDGHKLQRLFGEGCKKLVQEYAAAKTVRVLRTQGVTQVRRTVANDGTIRLRAFA